ncbi:hypothetical protein QFC20_006404 [Naganishia adeliensis]|uniref:Uncharacterized protein n=1 Tax=Naganishia adeliensis TaxID=92952 RepID=A0ACC2VBU4_9TREE|nr:hypothetical protein QFC20_006404 [Naganishia adeliensis]
MSSHHYASGHFSPSMNTAESASPPEGLGGDSKVESEVHGGQTDHSFRGSSDSAGTAPAGTTTGESANNNSKQHELKPGNSRASLGRRLSDSCIRGARTAKALAQELKPGDSTGLGDSGQWRKSMELRGKEVKEAMLRYAQEHSDSKGPPKDGST